MSVKQINAAAMNNNNAIFYMHFTIILSLLQVATCDHSNVSVKCSRKRVQYSQMNKQHEYDTLLEHYVFQHSQAKII